MNRLSRRICAGVFTGAGVLHFVMPKPYESIVPPGFGDPKLMVQISGVAEVIGGAAVVCPPLRSFARLWLIGLLAAVFPANVFMALKPKEFEKIPPALLWARLPLQPLMMWWVWRVTEKQQAEAA